jgi:hypothetical protein
MTELSPAAQKALAAFNERHELCGPFDDDWVEQCLAAALEAVADEVVPDEPSYMRDTVASLDWWDKHDSIRFELLAIAAELRGDTTPTETNGQT